MEQQDALPNLFGKTVAERSTVIGDLCRSVDGRQLLASDQRGRDIVLNIVASLKFVEHVQEVNLLDQCQGCRALGNFVIESDDNRLLVHELGGDAALVELALTSIDQRVLKNSIGAIGNLCESNPSLQTSLVQLKVGTALRRVSDYITPTILKGSFNDDADDYVTILVMVLKAVSNMMRDSDKNVKQHVVVQTDLWTWLYLMQPMARADLQIAELIIDIYIAINDYSPFKEDIVANNIIQMLVSFFDCDTVPDDDDDGQDVLWTVLLQALTMTACQGIEVVYICETLIKQVNITMDAFNSFPCLSRHIKGQTKIKLPYALQLLILEGFATLSTNPFGADALLAYLHQFVYLARGCNSNNVNAMSTEEIHIKTVPIETQRRGQKLALLVLGNLTHTTEHVSKLLLHDQGVVWKLMLSKIELNLVGGDIIKKKASDNKNIIHSIEEYNRELVNLSLSGIRHLSLLPGMIRFDQLDALFHGFGRLLTMPVAGIPINLNIQYNIVLILRNLVTISDKDGTVAKKLMDFVFKFNNKKEIEETIGDVGEIDVSNMFNNLPLLHLLLRLRLSDSQRIRLEMARFMAALICCHGCDIEKILFLKVGKIDNFGAILSLAATKFVALHLQLSNALYTVSSCLVLNKLLVNPSFCSEVEVAIENNDHTSETVIGKDDTSDLKPIYLAAALANSFACVAFNIKTEMRPCLGILAGSLFCLQQCLNILNISKMEPNQKQVVVCCTKKEHSNDPVACCQDFSAIIAKFLSLELLNSLTRVQAGLQDTNVLDSIDADVNLLQSGCKLNNNGVITKSELVDLLETCRSLLSTSLPSY